MQTLITAYNTVMILFLNVETKNVKFVFLLIKRLEAKTPSLRKHSSPFLILLRQSCIKDSILTSV